MVLKSVKGALYGILLGFSLVSLSSANGITSISTLSAAQSGLVGGGNGTQSQVTPVPVSTSPSTPTIEDQVGSQFSNQVADVENKAQIDHLQVFGENLFSHQCKSLPQIALYNPEYLISIGDQISLTMWGAFEFSQVLTVDSQGNIFIPKVGPLHVAGLPNGELNKLLNQAIKKTFEKNVSAYANLLSAQPVQVFVSGYVANPGLYDGISSDSALYFLCKAGGILPEQGSFRHIDIIRHGKVVRSIDLYDFLTNGFIPYAQLQQGDSIVVKPLHSSIDVVGKVRTPAKYEPKDDSFKLDRLLKLAGILPDATYALIQNNRGQVPHNDYLPIGALGNKEIKGGENITLTSDQNVKEITVSVTGSVYGPHQFVLPLGTTLADLDTLLTLRPNANITDLQLYRESIAQKQKEAIDSNLSYLEREVYTNNAVTKDGLAMQAQYADLVSKFVEKVKKVEPKGQVVVGSQSQWNDIVLQNNDVIHIPNQTSIVMVNGEVVMPTAVNVKPGESIEDYIEAAGGFAQNANDNYVLILKPNGEVKKVKLYFFSSSFDLKGGDQIFVMPAVSSETLPIFATISQIIFQVAVAAKIALSPL